MVTVFIELPNFRWCIISLSQCVCCCLGFVPQRTCQFYSVKKKYLSKEEGDQSNKCHHTSVLNEKKNEINCYWPLFIDKIFYVITPHSWFSHKNISTTCIDERAITNDLIKQRNQFSLKKNFKKKILGNKSPHFHPIQKKSLYFEEAKI